MSQHAASHHPFIVLGAVCLAGLMMPLSFTGPAVAMPAIARDLGGSPVALGWVVNAFVLSFGSAIMAAGALADQFGRKRLFGIGVAGFAILSVLLGFSPNVIVLDLLRAVQGIFAATALAGGTAALAQEFDGPARTRAFSLLGTTFGIGLAFGPIWCGYLIDTFGWRAIFLSGAVIGLIVLIFGLSRLRETRDPGATGIDWWGTLSFTATLVTLTFGIVQGPQSGWASPPVLALLIGSALLLALFITVETRVRRPMLDLSLFRYRRFVGAQFLPIATAYGFVVLLIFLPIRLIGIEGYGEVTAGLLMLPFCLPMVIVPFLAALLTRWISAAALSGIGLTIAAAGILWFSGVAPGADAARLVWPLATIGIGAGLPWGLMDDLSVSVVPKERAGMATGIFSTMRVAGEAIAIAIAGAVLVAATQADLHNTLTAVDAANQAHLPALIPALANDLAGGNLDAAAALLPEAGRPPLLQAYGNAFRVMLYVLAGVTFLSAVISVLLLRVSRQCSMPGPSLQPSSV